MTGITEKRLKRQISRSGLAMVTLLGAALVIFFAANAHLLYVASQSQPDCVPHNKPLGAAIPGIDYGAANSAC